MVWNMLPRHSRLVIRTTRGPMLVTSIDMYSGSGPLYPDGIATLWPILIRRLICCDMRIKYKEVMTAATVPIADSQGANELINRHVFSSSPRNSIETLNAFGSGAASNPCIARKGRTRKGRFAYHGGLVKSVARGRLQPPVRWPRTLDA